MRRQCSGPDEVEAALGSGQPLRLVMLAEDCADPRCAELLERARLAGAVVQRATANVLRRLSKTEPPAQILALVGDDPAASAEAALAGRDAAWLLVGVRYPGNLGFAIRTAEVSGADAVFIDAALSRPDKREHEGRREAVRAAMRADRFMPVFWEPAGEVLARARTAGRRIVAIEDVGDRAPWQVDLRGPALFVVGGERDGIDPALLAQADTVLRIPMRGFIPSYNLQAAMAVVVGERLRQLASEAGARVRAD